MFALLTTALAVESLVEFDALQTVPGTVNTGTLVITTCIVRCSASLSTSITTGVNNLIGTSSTLSVTVSCGATCRARARGLLQNVEGQTATITISGLTAAQAQVIANNIAAGNFVPYGIPPTATITATSATNVPLALTPSPVPFSPVAPASVQTSVCSQNANVRLGCSTSLATCSATAGAINAALFAGTTTVNAVCCQVGTSGQYQVTGVSGVARNTLCNNLPSGACGCGKNGSKKGLLGLLGLLGLIPLLLCLLICCLCCLRRKRRGQAMLFSQTAVPAPIPAPIPVPPPHVHAGPDFHVHP